MREVESKRWLARAIVTICAALAFAAPAAAQGVLPHPVAGDYRIRSVAYDADRVVNLAVLLGYQAMITFAPGERIENVSIGDSVSWQITPSRDAAALFLKPVHTLQSTNMIVVTNLRHYAFELSALPAGARYERFATYTLRFDYPRAETQESAPPDPLTSLQNLNFNYAPTGAERLYPARVFDDGRSTYFQFAENVDLPAIYVIGDDGREELVNTQMRGLYLVTDRVASAYVLRYGRLEARVSHGAPAPAQTGARRRSGPPR